MATIRLSDFKGMHNKSSENKMPEGYLREIINMNVDDGGLVSQRGGFVEKDDGYFTCIYSDNARCFCVRNGDLVEIKENGDDYSFTVIRADVGYVKLSFTMCDGHYYYVGDYVSGIITEDAHKTFGQEQVNYQPTLIEISGLMPAGTYRIAVTTLDADGMESGTKEPTEITIAANSAIALSNIFVSSDTRVTHIAIYLSAVNGEGLYRHAVITNGQTTYTIISQQNVNNFPLNSIGISPAPFGHLIAHHYGHLYIASGNYIFYCNNNFEYERWKPVDFFKYGSRVTNILPCENGIWVTTQKNGFFWINGKRPRHGVEAQGDMQQVKKHTANIKKNNAERIESDYMGNAAQTWSYRATANEGIFMLLDNGQFLNDSTANINLPTFTNCASAVLNNNDSFEYVAMIGGANIPERSL